MFLTATILTLQFFMSMPFLFFTLVLITVKKSLGSRSICNLKTPPGPPCAPVVGYLPYMRDDYHVQFAQLSEEYGPVYELFLGSKRTVVVSDYTLIREAFKQHVFSGRPDTELTKLMGGFGVINTQGPLWKEQRAFLHSVLKNFGAKNSNYSDSLVERSIKREVSGFLKHLHENSPEPLNAREPLARSVSNIIGSILMSVTYENSDDGGFVNLHNLIDEGFKLLTTDTYCNFVPILKYVPYFNRNYKKIKQNKEKTSEYFKTVADNHFKNFDEDNVKDIVDEFFLKKKKLTKENKPSSFSEKQLWQFMGDIFSAGLETVTTTLEWALIFLLVNPEVQENLFEEIERVIGTSRDPEFSDLPHMPYLEATMLEVQRRGNAIALGNTHATLNDTTLGGFLIPKGTHVIPNLWAIHMDPKLWDEPEAFKPERFIVDNKIVKPPYFMPFSVGRRMCVGDILSKMEMFHFLANIVQKFELTVPEGEPMPDLTGISNISLQAKKFKMCAIPRQM